MNFFFDLKKKDITLGGFLTFRKECELIASIENKKIINVYIDSFKKDKKKVNFFVKKIFKTSIKKFVLKKNIKNFYKWPKNLTNHPNYSFMKINFLFRKYKIFPLLLWDKKILHNKLSFFKKFKKKNIFSVHLKYIKPYNHIGNANLNLWKNFFNDNKDSIFLIIGHDDYPKKFKCKNLIFVKDVFKDLALQLALVQKTDAFIGTASGVTTAANFSDKPYIIFKEPNHDKSQILKELKKKNYLFAKKGQKIIRKRLNKKELNNAIDYLKKFIKKK